MWKAIKTHSLEEETSAWRFALSVGQQHRDRFANQHETVQRHLKIKQA